MAKRWVTLVLLLSACGRTGFDGTGVDPLPTATGTATPGTTPTPAPPFFPAAVTGELVHSAPARGWWSPLARRTLPKLAADGQWLYAAHADLNTQADRQTVTLLRKRRDAAAGAPWEEVAVIARPDYEPAGIAMDALDRLHLVFRCRRDAGGVIDIDIGGGGDRCFAGYAAGQEERAWHVVFGDRNGDALRFDVSTGTFDESIAGDDGDLGLAAVGARTWWTSRGTGGERVVRVWDGPTTWAPVTLGPIGGGRVLVQPLLAASPAGTGEAVLFAGEYDPVADELVAASAFQSMQNSLAEVARRNAAGASPLDIAFEKDGTLVVLHDTDASKEILRFDGGLGSAPVTLPIDVSSSASLQINSAGHWYVLDETTAGAKVRLGASADRGVTWTWREVAIEGLPSNGDVSFRGFTALEPHSANGAYDADRFVFLFTGMDDMGAFRATYLGSMSLK